LTFATDNKLPTTNIFYELSAGTWCHSMSYQL
jgi:hypothetical protein